VLVSSFIENHFIDKGGVNFGSEGMRKTASHVVGDLLIHAVIDSFKSAFGNWYKTGLGQVGEQF